MNPLFREYLEEVKAQGSNLKVKLEQEISELDFVITSVQAELDVVSDALDCEYDQDPVSKKFLTTILELNQEYNERLSSLYSNKTQVKLRLEECNRECSIAERLLNESDGDSNHSADLQCFAAWAWCLFLVGILFLRNALRVFGYCGWHCMSLVDPSEEVLAAVVEAMLNAHTESKHCDEDSVDGPTYYFARAAASGALKAVAEFYKKTPMIIDKKHESWLWETISEEIWDQVIEDAQ